MKMHCTKILQYIADTDESDTYGDVLKRCIRAALHLRDKGITKDDIISTCTHNHKNTIVPFIASLFLGVKSANFDTNLPQLDTIHLLKLIKPKIMFVASQSVDFMVKCLEEAQVETEIVVFGDSTKYSTFSSYLDSHPEEDLFEPVYINNIKETAVIMFSSGTTGLPKGICLNHYGLFRQFLFGDIVSSESNSTLLTYTTLYWISSVILLISCISTGNSKVVCSKFIPSDVSKLIEKYKVTGIFLTPFYAGEFLAGLNKNYDISSVKYFLTGGGMVTENLIRNLNEALPHARIIQGYGQTEASAMLTAFNCVNDEEVKLQMKKPLSCGKAVRGIEWKVVDPNTEEILGPNQRGEFRYKSDKQMNGYYNQDSSSAYDSEGFIKSGDIVYYDEDQCFYIVDRIKEMFKYKEWHILPAILESVLLTNPAVKEAAVVGIPHDLDGDYPTGIVVLNKGYEHVTGEEIEKYIEDRVPDVQRLRGGVKIVKEILKTTTGKIRRPAIKQMILSNRM